VNICTKKHARTACNFSGYVVETTGRCLKFFAPIKTQYKLFKNLRKKIKRWKHTINIKDTQLNGRND